MNCFEAVLLKLNQDYELLIDLGIGMFEVNTNEDISAMKGI